MRPIHSWLLVALISALAAHTGSSAAAAAALLASGWRPAEQPQVGAAAQPRDSTGAVLPLFNAIQSQAQRQINQINGLVLGAAPNMTASGTASQQVGNVLEVLSNVGKAIQQQIMNGPIATGSSNRFVSIVTSQNGNSEPATNKKNEYQSIVATDGQQLNLAEAVEQPGFNLSSANPVNHREQSEVLRQEIVRRASQLQQVVASSMEALKNNGDLIVRRLLEQLNSRLDQAKSKADKIINEPATTDVAMKALHTINSGLNNLNNIITNIVNRLDLGSKDGQMQPLPAVANLSGATQRVASNANALLEAARSRLNLHQLGQQFSSALNAVQQQQRQQQAAASGQLQQPLAVAGDNKKTW